MEEGVTAVSGPKWHSCGYFGDALTLLGIPYCSHLVIGALAWGLQILPQRLIGAHLLSVQSLLSSTLLILQDPAPTHPKKTISHRDPVCLVLFVFVIDCWFGWLNFDTVSYYEDLTGLELVM